jgi:type VI secretion system secreted protein Hcp
VSLDLFLQFVATAQASPIVVVGESVDKSHPQTIALSAVEFGVENTATIGTASGGAGAGKAKFRVLKVSKQVDSASPSLFKALVTGAHFTQAKIFVRRAGGTTPVDYATYQFGLVYVTDIDVSGSSGGDALEETVTLAYGAMQMTYSPLTATGAADKQQVATWNQVTNSDNLTMPTP